MKSFLFGSDPERDVSICTGGLHQFAGKPPVAGEEKLEAAMKREFLECRDESVSRIVTTNYGRFETDLKTEWEFVVNPIIDRSPHYPGQKVKLCNHDDHSRCCL
jgi:hypothetical protein